MSNTELYRDYFIINGETVTVFDIEELIAEYRNEIKRGSEYNKTLTKFEYEDDEETLRKKAFLLTNGLSEVGALLARAYAVQREISSYRNLIRRAWETLTFEDLAEARISGKNKDIMAAGLANRYPLVYTSLKMLDEFSSDEVDNYINELTVLKEVFSRQVAALDVEFRLTSITT